MVIIEERETKKVPGLTSLFICPFDTNLKNRIEILSVIKSLVCRDFNKKTNEWEIPLSHLTELIEKISLYSEINLKLLDINKAQDISTRLSNFKTKPYPYQEEGIRYGLNHNNWLLLDGMGLGKSLQAIYLAEEINKRDKIKHCLIICGVNTLKKNWKKEIERHSKLDCVILGEKITKTGRSVAGSIKERADQLMKPIKEFFIITNIETLREEIIINAFNKGPNKIDMIVVDEIHCAKNPSSTQSKHLLKLNKADYKLGMTGTLLLNDPLDAYVPLKWLGFEKSSYTTFKYHYCNYVGQFHNILIGYRNTSLLKDQLNKCSLRRVKEDVLDLPPKTIIPEYLEMDNKQANFYENIKKGIIDEVDKVTISTASLLSMVARLRQATACPSILTSECIDSVKINRAIELTEQIIANGDKVVIFSTFKETVYELERKLSKYNPLIGTGDIKDYDISANVDLFQNDPNSQIFIGTWQKCGTGITLTSATYMIFIDTPWTSALFEQSCDRIYRIGTKNAVFIYNLICKDTIDERVQELIDSKKLISEYIIDDRLDENSIDNLRKYIEDLKV